MDCTIYEAKTNTLMSCAATAKSGFSHDVAYVIHWEIFFQNRERD